MNHPALVRLSKAEQALALATDLSDFKKIIDIAEAARVYARAAKLGEGSARHAEEIKLKAQRGAGHFLAKLEKGKGGDRKSKRHDVRLVSVYRAALKDAEVEPKAAQRYQQVAAVPEPKFTGYLKEARETQKEATTAGLLREAKAEVKVQRKQAVIEQIRNEPQSLPHGPFRVLVIDPPWKYNARGDDDTHRARNPYPDMTLEEIKALPVPTLAHKDAILWLWTTNAFLLEAFGCLEAWGFQHKTMLTWVKDRMGTGDWLRGKTEHCLMAIRGKPVVTLTNQTTALLAPLREHSRKPDEFYALVEESVSWQSLRGILAAASQGLGNQGRGEGEVRVMNQEAFLWGRISENKIARFLCARGWAIQPVYEKETEERDKGPRVYMADGFERIAPDLLAFNASRARWVEAKAKTRCTWHKISRSWQTGIDVACYEDYQALAVGSPFSLWILFLHEHSIPRVQDLKDGCPPECPTGLFGANILNLPYHHMHPNWGRRGMVYWKIDDLKPIATLDDFYAALKVRPIRLPPEVESGAGRQRAKGRA